MRCLPASLRRGPGGPRCPHRSDAGTEIRDSVNEALVPVAYLVIKVCCLRFITRFAFNLIHWIITRCAKLEKVVGECIHLIFKQTFVSVHGAWGGWSDWGTCSSSCGVGLRRRDRNCDSPWPSKDGNYCNGDNINYEICSDADCHGSCVVM